MIPYLFVLIPLGLYLPLFSYETWSAFTRLNKRGKRGGAYVDATWEVTHTFLIIGLTNFIWLFSANARGVAKAAYWGLITAGAAFIMRAILYLYIFYVSDLSTKHNKWPDKLFALSHIVVLVGLSYAIVNAWIELAGARVIINTQFIPWMWPGLVLLLALGSLPLIRLYTTKD